MTPDLYIKWLATSRRGERCVYYRGNLSAQRIMVSERAKGGYSIKDVPEVCGIADTAYSSYLLGKALLFQRRTKKSTMSSDGITMLGDGEFNYEAVRL